MFNHFDAMLQKQKIDKAHKDAETIQDFLDDYNFYLYIACLGAMDNIERMEREIEERKETEKLKQKLMEEYEKGLR
jgi:hypothetical protein